MVLVRYPFSDLTAAKIRPAVVVGALRRCDDYFIAPLTSRTDLLGDGEFVLTDWQAAGLNLRTALKRGLYTVHGSLFLKSLGRLSPQDARQLEQQCVSGWSFLSFAEGRLSQGRGAVREPPRQPPATSHQLPTTNH